MLLATNTLRPKVFYLKCYSWENYYFVVYYTIRPKINFKICYRNFVALLQSNQILIHESFQCAEYRLPDTFHLSERNHGSHRISSNTIVPQW